MVVMAVGCEKSAWPYAHRAASRKDECNGWRRVEQNGKAGRGRTKQQLGPKLRFAR
jgi:hypothetical protein